MPRSLFRQVATAALILLPFTSVLAQVDVVAAPVVDTLKAQSNVPQTRYSNATQARTGLVSAEVSAEALQSIPIVGEVAQFLPRDSIEARQSYSQYKTVMYFPNWVCSP
jgi:hypothetical protein